MHKTKIIILAVLLATALWTSNALAVSYTLAQVQTHNSASDCWTIVGSNVYNLTSYISAHPGGVGAISSICGVNGTATFTAIHGSSAGAQAALATLLIGTLGTTPPAIDTSAPTIPASLSATAVSGSQINLSWTASTDNVAVTGYHIYRGGILIGTSTVNYFINTGLATSTSYSYNVTAFDAAGNSSAQSNTATATTMSDIGADTSIPTVPQNLVATAVSASQINLTWTASTDAVAVTGYNVYRNGILLGTVATNSIANTGLAANTSYSYYVSAFDAAHNTSGISNTASATTLATGGTTGGTTGSSAGSYTGEANDAGEHRGTTPPPTGQRAGREHEGGRSHSSGNNNSGNSSRGRGHANHND